MGTRNPSLTMAWSSAIKIRIFLLKFSHYLEMDYFTLVSTQTMTPHIRLKKFSFHHSEAYVEELTLVPHIHIIRP